jgi:hypothetical protein
MMTVGLAELVNARGGTYRLDLCLCSRRACLTNKNGGPPLATPKVRGVAPQGTAVQSQRCRRSAVTLVIGAGKAPGL